MTDDRPRHPGPVYANEAGPDHVGRRATIRHLVEDTDGRSRPTDVVGVIRRWDAGGTVAVERRDGEVVHLHAGAIVASRLLPDAPPRRRGRAGGGGPTGSARG